MGKFFLTEQDKPYPDSKKIQHIPYFPNYSIILIEKRIYYSVF